MIWLLFGWDCVCDVDVVEMDCVVGVFMVVFGYVCVCLCVVCVWCDVVVGELWLLVVVLDWYGDDLCVVVYVF